MASLNFSPALVNLIDKDLATVPRVQLGGYSTISPWESGDGTNSSLIHMLVGNFTKLQGTHNLKFGTDVRLGRAFGNRFPSEVSPAFNFPNTYTRGPLDNSPPAQIGQELASMLVGVPGGSMVRTASYAIQSRFMGLYLHDDFKVSRTFTLNLGLRYEKGMANHGAL